MGTKDVEGLSTFIQAMGMNLVLRVIVFNCSSNGNSVSSNGGNSTFFKRDEDGYKKMDMNSVAQFGA